MRNGKIGYAIIGTGVVAPLHATSIKRDPDAELIAVVDTSREKAIEFQRKYESVRSYTGLEECFQDDKVDVVCICTPSGTHGDLAIKAAKAGKHVLCEKPLEIRTEKMSEMIRICRQENIKLGAVFQRRMLDVTVQVKQMVEKNVFGKLVLGDAYLKYYRNQEYYDSAGWRGTWEMDGGGARMNQGVHGVDIIQWLNGGVKKVFARAAALARNIEVEDTALAVVEYNNGAFGVIEGSTIVYPGQVTRFELHGENGTVIFNDQEIRVCETISGKVDPNKWKLDSDLPFADVPSLGHYRFIRDMSRAVLEDRDPVVPGEEARKAVDVILAIYESAKTGREIIME